MGLGVVVRSSKGMGVAVVLLTALSIFWRHILFLIFVNSQQKCENWQKISPKTFLNGKGECS